MKLKVNLGCERCYKKIKRLIYKIPGETLSIHTYCVVVVVGIINVDRRNWWSVVGFWWWWWINNMDGIMGTLTGSAIKEWAYNEKEHTVVIKVVCCSPEKIRQKLIRKGGDNIQSIEIIDPVPPPPPEPPRKPPVTGYPPCVLYPFPLGEPVCCNQCFEVRGDGGGCGCGCGSHSTSISACRCGRSYAYCSCEIYTYNEPPSLCAIMWISWANTYSDILVIINVVVWSPSFSWIFIAFLSRGFLFLSIFIMQTRTLYPSSVSCHACLNAQVMNKLLPLFRNGL